MNNTNINDYKFTKIRMIKVVFIPFLFSLLSFINLILNSIFFSLVISLL